MSHASSLQVWSRMLGVAMFAAQCIGSAASAQGTGRRMPRLIGLDTTRAIAVLRVYPRVRWAIVPRFSTLVPIDSIVDQRPLPGSLLRATDTVRLFLAGRAVVPQLVGHTETEATRMLEAARLRGRPDTEPATADSEIHRVVRQSPNSGALVLPDSAIEFWLGTDPRFAMPGVVGLTRAGAETKLRTAGLTTAPAMQRVTGDGTPIDSVVAQRPDSGTLVWPSGSVVLTLGRRLSAVVPQVGAVDTRPRLVPPQRPGPATVITPHRPTQIDWPLIAIAAIALVLVGGTLAARAAWLPTVTSSAEVHGYPPRVTVDEPPLLAGDVAVRAHVETYPSRVSITGSRSLLV